MIIVASITIIGTITCLAILFKCVFKIGQVISEL